MNFKPISISLSPNVQKQDLALSLHNLFQPWSYKKGPTIKKLEEKFKKDFGASSAWSFNSGRSALLTLLQVLELEKGDEIAIQAFTCNAVPNPIFWVGAKPLYIDIDESFNLDPQDLKKKLTAKTKVVIIQHTFGVPAQIEKVQAICKEHKLILVEDMAHGLGSKYKGKLLGTFGDFAFFSFGRDKVISSVYGGMLASHRKGLNKKIDKVYKKVRQPSFVWTAQQLFHPLALSIILPTYKLLIGKLILVGLQKARLLSMAVHKKERCGKKPGYFPARLPNALAKLALSQYQRLSKFNQHRKKVAKAYKEALRNSKFKLTNCSKEVVCNFFRYTIRHSQAHQIIRKAWDQNLLLGDWYTDVLIPCSSNLKKLGYEPGSCPRAEKASKETLNLPTHVNISKKDVEEIVNFIKEQG